MVNVTKLLLENVLYLLQHIQIDHDRDTVKRVMKNVTRFGYFKQKLRMCSILLIMIITFLISTYIVTNISFRHFNTINSRWFFVKFLYSLRKKVQNLYNKTYWDQLSKTLLVSQDWSQTLQHITNNDVNFARNLDSLSFTGRRF